MQPSQLQSRRLAAIIIFLVVLLLKLDFTAKDAKIAKPFRHAPARPYRHSGPGSEAGVNSSRNPVFPSFLDPGFKPG